MSYIDGFVTAVPTADREKYIEHARVSAAVFLELGATQVQEYWGDDVPDGEQTDFRRAVQAKSDETVVFSWTHWPDKATRDAAWNKAMKDPRLVDREKNPMPFDDKRMIYGGFASLLQSPA